MNIMNIINNRDLDFQSTIEKTILHQHLEEDPMSLAQIQNKPNAIKIVWKDWTGNSLNLTFSEH
ncbi:hypothetical protein G9P44_001361 [Scheffersomyces stipitis]|nr:hypothetical protein G9P44_001361 [Scheffersomyces stipitis]